MLLRSWLSPLTSPSHRRPRRRKAPQDRRQAAEVLEDKLPLGDGGFTAVGASELVDLLASNGTAAVPPDDGNPEPASSDKPLVAKTETAPPDDEQFPVTPTPDRRPATPPDRIDTPPQDADDLESLFADGGLESALLTNPPAISTPPPLEPLDLPELSQPRETGGGGASGHNPEAGNGIGGANGTQVDFGSTEGGEITAIKAPVKLPNDATITRNSASEQGTASATTSLAEENCNGTQFVIDFNNMADGTTVTDQFWPAVFSADPGNTNVVRHFGYGVVVATAPYDGMWNNNMYVDFTVPVNDLTFVVFADDRSATGAQVRVFEQGQYSATDDIVGDGDPHNPQTIDLSTYQNVTRIEIINISDPYGLTWDTFQFCAMPPVDLIAHHTGDQLGEPLTEETEDESDSAKYLILTNNDFEQDLPNGRPDFYDYTAVIPSGAANDDDDLAQITLKKIAPGLTDGSIELQLSYPDAVRLFESDGSLLYDSVATGTAPLTLDLANPSGYLADLTSGDVDVWLEGLEPVPDVTFSIIYKDADGQEISRDDVHVNIAELTFVNAEGYEVRTIPPLWKESLIALAESGIDMTSKALPSFFKMRVEGLAGTGPFEMTGQSNTYPGDQFEDILVPVGSYVYESEHYITMYSSRNVYGASPDLMLTDTERQLLLTELNLKAVHNEEGTFKLRLGAGSTWHRPVKTQEFMNMKLSQDIAHPGDTITASVTHQSAEDDWKWIATFPDGSTQTKIGRSVQFTFQVNAVGDRVFSVKGSWVQESPFTYYSITATGSSRIRVLPVGEQMSQWELAAWKALRIGGARRTGNISADPIRLNRVITENYAKIYNEAKDDPNNPNDNAQLEDAFQWAGMAAFASNAVGNAIAETEYWMAKPTAFVPDPGIAYDLLSRGNLDFYMDLYPQHLAYRDGGIAAIRAMRAAGSIEQRQLDAWELIHQGVVNNDASKIWDGNRDLLEFEQEILLQEVVYDVNPQYWTDLTNEGWPVPPFDSPIPGHGISFQEYRTQDPAVPDMASLGSFSARWAWVANEDPNTPPSMFDAWKQWDATHGDIDIQKLLDDKYLP